MAFKVLSVLLLVVYVANVSGNKAGLRAVGGHGAAKDEDKEVDWYDCSKKEDGNYPHPFECTKFMSCVARSHAYERNCATCHEHPTTCPDGRTHYNHPADACLWADEAGCTPGTTEGPPPTPTTTARPDPLRCEAEEADDCRTDGWCHDYRWCERHESDHKGKGKPGWKRNGTCPEELNLYFNPNRSNNNLHGGVCDWWENLDEETQAKYNNDPDCIDPHCEWKSNGECSESYIYFHPEKNDGQDVTLECRQRPVGERLVWDQGRKNCHLCSTVFRADGTTPCC